MVLWLSHRFTPNLVCLELQIYLSLAQKESLHGFFHVRTAGRYNFQRCRTNMQATDLLQAMASPEDKAYDIMRELDVDYVLVIFGGLTGYSSDGRS